VTDVIGECTSKGAAMSNPSELESVRERLVNIIMIAEHEMDCAMSIESIATIKKEFEASIDEAVREERERIAKYFLSDEYIDSLPGHSPLELAETVRACGKVKEQP
jgi:hypothetical protein